MAVYSYMLARKVIGRGTAWLIKGAALAGQLGYSIPGGRNAIFQGIVDTSPLED
jgi:hypothetical protein